MKVLFKRLKPGAIQPTYATPGAAAFDIYAAGDAYLPPGGAVTIGTGFAFEFPEEYAMLVFPRSGLAFKSGVSLVNGVAVIDSDYRGELMIGLQRRPVRDVPMMIRFGDRIAQGMMVPRMSATFVEADDLSETRRGAGGLGSTGV